MSRQSSIFKRLEKFTGGKYPIFIKDILESCGYDHESTLILLNENSIKEIESEVEGKKDLIKNTVYEHKDGPFSFLIGHKQLILNIPNILKKISEQKKLEKKSKKKEFSEASGEELNELKAETVGNKAVERINKYLESKNFSCSVNVAHIKLITLAENGAKCMVKCIFCDSETTCTFQKHWNIANYIAHIRKHPQAILPDQRPHDVITPVAGETQRLVQRGNSSVLSEIETILR